MVLIIQHRPMPGEYIVYSLLVSITIASTGAFESHWLDVAGWPES